MDADRPDTGPITNFDGLMVLSIGALKAWLILLIGITMGYGFVSLISPQTEVAPQPIFWNRLMSSSPAILFYFGGGGFMIETLRMFGEPIGKMPAWRRSGSRRLRLSLFACLAMAAVAMGSLCKMRLES